VENDSVPEVCPARFDQVDPASVDTCHCGVGAGTPDAAAVKETDVPAVTVWLAGWADTTGPVCTVSTAVFVVVDDTTLVNTARYR
jgi:hypothetical protein